MARYKKRTGYDEGSPGLFDDLESSLFHEASRFPVHPGIQKEALNRLQQEEDKRRKELFDGDDTFSPLEDVPAIDRINDSYISELLLLDTIPYPADQEVSRKIKYLSVAPIFADAIRRIYEEVSISSLFD